MTTVNAAEFIDLGIRPAHLLSEVLVGLSKSQKSINPKYLYDKKGSEIFEEIAKLPEYYPTRTESQILKKYAKQISSFIGSNSLIIEPGSGSGEKIKYLLPHLKNILGFVPIEISKQTLLRMTDEFMVLFPEIKIIPVCADFTQQLEFPISINAKGTKKVIFFPGSTIGNFHPVDAINLLKSFAKIVGKSGGLLIGVDTKKSAELLRPAYDDSFGVTRDFNLNLLTRLNREINANFDLAKFEHHVVYDEMLGRIEMHLRSKIDQLVRVHQTVFRFKEGETIHTECSYKYRTDEFCELAAKARFTIKKMWMDSAKLFCVYYFERE